LTRERIQGTVWGDILMVNRNSFDGSRQPPTKRSDVMLMAAKINIDIAEIENLFGIGQKKGKQIHQDS
jgi:hypothetical protein